MIERAHNREAARNGVEEPLISIGEAALDRMPTLSLIFDEAAANFTRVLEEFSEIQSTASIEDLEATRVSDLENHCAGLSTILVYDAGGLGSKLAVAVDEGFRDLVIELMLGSSVVERTTQGERAATRVESRLLDFAVSKLLSALAGAFAPIAQLSFERDTSSDEAGFSSIGQKAAVVIVGRCRLKAADQDGTLAIVLPRSALDPFRAELSRQPGAASAVQDDRWTENLYDHVVRTEVKVNVKIEARGFTLDDIARLEVGDVLRLPIAPTSPIRIESEGRTLFWCTLGQKDGHYTVRLEDFSDERQSFIENILGV